MPPARRTQAERRVAARSQIEAAALRVFTVKGYAAASMDDVRLAAGCSKGGLYHHFPSKPALLGAIAARLSGAGGLRPPFNGAARVFGLSEQAFGRLLLDIWSEAQRQPELQTLLAAPGTAQPAEALAAALDIGMLIQQVTHMAPDAADAARRMGVRRAA
jgi:AcrR family transcriptional regulator